MKEIKWTLSVNRKEDKEKIKLLCERGKLLRYTAIRGRPVCWEYVLEGAHDREGNPVRVTAWVGTGC